MPKYLETNTLLINLCIKEKIKKEIRMYFELKSNVNQNKQKKGNSKNMSQEQ